MSFMNVPLASVDVESGCSLELRAFRAGTGASVLARVRSAEPGPWSDTPQLLLRGPRFDSDTGEVAEDEGRATGALRMFGGVFEVDRTDLQGDLLAEWSLRTPLGSAVLRAGTANEGPLAWWLRCHQQVGGSYWTLDA